MNHLNRDSPITLIELPPWQFGKVNGDAGYDIYSKFRLPSRALDHLKAILVADGWNNVTTINPMYHGNGGRLTPENERRIYSSSVLAISSITRTASQSLVISRAYKQLSPDGIVVAGGFDPTFRAQQWLEEGRADVVVIGEGDRTFPDLMARLAVDQNDLSGIPGIIHRKGNDIVKNFPRESLAPKELSELPYPVYDPQVRRAMRTKPIETTRGCPFNCDFCTVHEFHGGYRIKSPDWVIGALKSQSGIKGDVFFTDDNLARNRGYTLEILAGIEHSGMRISLSAQTDVKGAKDLELLRAFKRAGGEGFYLGVESINPETLKALRKPFTPEQNTECMDILGEERFWRHGMMIVGEDHDTPESLRETLEWAKKYLDSVQFFAPAPLPGSKLAKRMAEEGRILSHDPWLYDAQHVLIRPKNFTPHGLQTTITRMYEDFYSPANMARKLLSSPNKGRTFGIGVFLHLMGGKNNILHNAQTQDHLEFLKRIS